VPREDCDLQNRVIRALRATGYPALRDIDVTVSESTVLLAGRTPTYYLKQTAQSAAMAVAGQHVVSNEILVTEPRAGVAAI
jgi:osmotically-inducible protein OsmY